MKQTRSSIAFILTALLLMLCIQPAIADAPTADLTVAGYLESGKNLQMDIKVELNPKLGSLAMDYNGEKSDEIIQNEITTLFSAIKKLKTSLIVSKSSASGTMGTDNGTLIDFQASFNSENAENHITSSLFPGLNISLDPASIAQLTAQTKQLQTTLTQLQPIITPYAKAIVEKIEEYQQTLTTEQGRFEIYDYGTFNKRTQLTLTSHMVADLLGNLADVYKSDKKLKEYADGVAKTTQLMGEGNKFLEDFFQSIEKASKECKAQEDNPLLVIWAYENADSLYLDGVAFEGTDRPIKIDLMINGRTNSVNNAQIGISLKVIGKGMGRKVEGRDDTREIDWAAIQQEILPDSNHTDTLITMNLNTTSEPQETNTELVLAVVSDGMNAGLDIKGESNMATMKNNTVACISFLYPDPLMKMTFSSKPTEKNPVVLVLDDTVPVIIRESGMSVEENGALQESLVKGTIELLVRMGTALPEDALDIIKLAEKILPSINQLMHDQMGLNPRPEQTSIQDLEPTPAIESEPYQDELQESKPENP